MPRQNISSGAPWENTIGYSRAVRKGNMVWVSGTVAVDEHEQLVGGNNAAAQAYFILEKIEKALAKAGAQLADVVRTRIYVTNISHWEEVGKAHGAYFSQIKPATSMVEVKALIRPEYLVEIEAEAVIGTTDAR